MLYPEPGFPSKKHIKWSTLAWNLPRTASTAKLSLLGSDCWSGCPFYSSVASRSCSNNFFPCSAASLLQRRFSSALVPRKRIHWREDAAVGLNEYGRRCSDGNKTDYREFRLSHRKRWKTFWPWGKNDGKPQNKTKLRNKETRKRCTGSWGVPTRRQKSNVKKLLYENHTNFYSLLFLEVERNKTEDLKKWINNLT